MPLLPHPQAIIFDLDGTLVDSLKDIGEAFNESLELMGLPTYPIEDYRHMVGEGIPMLARRAAGDRRPELVTRLAEIARARYRTRPLRYTLPYTGVRELVAALAGRGVPLAVLSNKPQDMTALIVGRLWPGGEFRAVHGYVEESLRKPDPTVAGRIAEALGARPGDTWVVGDTPTDIETARRLQAVSVSVTWGFRPREELAAAGPTTLVDSPAALGALLGL